MKYETIRKATLGVMCACLMAFAAAASAQDHHRGERDEKRHEQGHHTGDLDRHGKWNRERDRDQTWQRERSRSSWRTRQHRSPRSVWILHRPNPGLHRGWQNDVGNGRTRRVIRRGAVRHLPPREIHRRPTIYRSPGYSHTSGHGAIRH